MSYITLSHVISVWVFVFVISGISFGQDHMNQLVSPDLFGELVDIVTPGYLHWNQESGGVVDPDGDENDIDNNFGEHGGFVDSPEFSSKVTTYGSGNVAEELVYVYGDRTVGWNFEVPELGQYILVTRLWRELRKRTDIAISYNSSGEWVDLPVVEDVQYWGGYGNLVCFLIQVKGNQKTIPVRVRALSGRGVIYRILLGRKRESSPFNAKGEHPCLYFDAADISGLREKVKDGPPKLAYDYMVQQVNWYTNTINR